jgi:protein gp37
MSNIEWTDTVWNPVTGCAKVSEGCRNCYAFELHDRRHKGWKAGNWSNAPKQYHKPFSEVQLFPDRLDMPLKWRKPRRVFVNSMSDLFHEDVPEEFIRMVFAVMGEAEQHMFQILTKRPKRMMDIVNRLANEGDFATISGQIKKFPYTNVWLGTSVENQKAADERISLLLQTPAAVRFLSCEPLLGPVDLSVHLNWTSSKDRKTPLLNWVIAGGESGNNARPMHQDWARSLRDQCNAVDVPFFLKQWGEFYPHEFDEYDPEYWITEDGFHGLVHTSICTHYEGELAYMNRIGKKKAGRLLDGREWNEMPK